MEENKDINLEQENIQENKEQETTNSSAENLTQEPTSEELLAQEKDKYIRLYAEFDNFKRRTAKEKIEFIQFANQGLMISLLDVLDDFERALKELGKQGNEENLKGVELIYNKFFSKLKEKGLEKLEVNPGDNFNVDLHEAITQIDAPSEDLKGKIVDVIETGYKLHDHIIRFAKVVTGK